MYITNNTLPAFEDFQGYTNATGFATAFVSAFSMIVVSEIGDRTFFIVAVMAMQYNRCLVYAGAMSSLSIMHGISTLFGYSAAFIPRRWTQLASIALFTYFGVKQLRKASKKPTALPDDVIEARKEDLAARSALRRWNWLAKLPVLSPVFVEAFVINFLAEWGDNSQIATVAFGASGVDLLGILLGGLLGHGLCNALAVIGGSFVAKVISPRSMTYLCGFVFLLFAISTTVKLLFY